MGDTKSNYSNDAKLKIAESKFNKDVFERYKRAKDEEAQFQHIWKSNGLIDLNKDLAQFGQIIRIKYEGSRKKVYITEKYRIESDLFSGGIRFYDKTLKRYVKLDKTPGNNDQTHFKIKKEEEM